MCVFLENSISLFLSLNISICRSHIPRTPYIFRISRTVALENPENLVASDDLDLRDTVGVAEGDTDLRGCGAFLGHLADLVDDLIGGGLEPGWGSAGGNVLAIEEVSWE